MGSFADTTYPREGTETYYGFAQSHVEKQTQLIPARGRKQAAGRVRRFRNGHNLSPRGDGNRSDCRAAGAPLDTTYPREGTETFSGFYISLPPYDTTYPREGTETVVDRLHGRRGLADTTYPREGTETQEDMKPRRLLLTQLIPARGRKPSLRPIPQNCWAGHNLSPRGDGNQHFRLLATRKKPDTTYPREGTETADGCAILVSSKRHNLSPRGDGNSSAGARPSWQL